MPYCKVILFRSCRVILFRSSKVILFRNSKLILFRILRSFYSVIVRSFYSVVVGSFYSVVVRSFYSVVLRSFYSVVIRPFYSVVVRSFYCVDIRLFYSVVVRSFYSVILRPFIPKLHCHFPLCLGPLFSYFYDHLIPNCWSHFKSVQWEPSCSTRTYSRTDRHYEANSRVSEFCEGAWRTDLCQLISVPRSLSCTQCCWYIQTLMQHWPPSYITVEWGHACVHTAHLSTVTAGVWPG
jgi:hypothetical protein